MFSGRYKYRRISPPDPQVFCRSRFKYSSILGLSCGRGARREVTEDRNTSDRGAAHEDDIVMLWTKVLQKTPRAGLISYIAIYGQFFAYSNE
jgi:hypothetical protein